MVDVGFTQISEKGTATLFSTDVNGATGVCPRCDNESFCKPRDFSAKAWQALLVWHEVENSLKNQALCNDCYLELREILIDRADEVELASTQEPEPLTIVKIQRKRMELRKDMPAALRSAVTPAATKGATSAPLSQNRKAQGADLATNKGNVLETAKLPAKAKVSSHNSSAEKQALNDQGKQPSVKAVDTDQGGKSPNPTKGMQEPKKESLLQKVAQTVREAVSRSKKVAQVLEKSSESKKTESVNSLSHTEAKSGGAKGFNAKKAEKMPLQGKTPAKAVGKASENVKGGAGKSVEAAGKKFAPAKAKAVAGGAGKSAPKKAVVKKVLVKKGAAKKAPSKPAVKKANKKAAVKAAPKKKASASPKKSTPQKTSTSKVVKSAAKKLPKKAAASAKRPAKSKSARR